MNTLKWTAFVTLSFALVYNSSAFAAAQIVCESEDGSAFQAIIDESDNVSQVRTRVRDGKFVERPYAHVTGLDLARGADGVDKVKSLIIIDGRKIVVAVAAGTYADENGGSYEILSCEASY